MTCRLPTSCLSRMYAHLRLALAWRHRFQRYYGISFRCCAASAATCACVVGSRGKTLVPPYLLPLLYTIYRLLFCLSLPAFTCLPYTNACPDISRRRQVCRLRAGAGVVFGRVRDRAAHAQRRCSAAAAHASRCAPLVLCRACCALFSSALTAAGVLLSAPALRVILGHDGRGGCLLA